MTSSTSYRSLASRVDRLHAQLAELKARQEQFTQPGNRTSLPGAEAWPDFARRTWIKTEGGVKPFNPYDFQVDLVRKIHTSPNVIVNKSRQLGVSETIGCYLGDRAATEPGFAAVIFSKTQVDSSNLARRFRYMLYSIHGHSFTYDSDSNTLISVKGGGTLYFLPGSPRAARGIPSGSVLWLDEAAFIDGAGEIYRAASPVLAMLGDAGKVIVTSTPNFELDFFGSIWNSNIPADWYDHIEEARLHPEDGPQHLATLNARLAAIQDGWTRVAIHYTQHPVYSADPEWATKTRTGRKLTQSAWNSEFELSFGSTDAQVYPTALIARAARGHLRECGHVGRAYVIGIDPNAGGNDFFTTIVLDITQAPYEVVALYHENGRSTDYSLRHVKQLIEDFIPERVIVEKQAMGSVIAEALQGALPAYAIELFNTTRPSKTVATDRILYLLERDELVFPEGVIPSELRAFQHHDDGSRSAAAGHHDDCVMSLAFACSLIPETPNTAAFFQNI